MCRPPPPRLLCRRLTRWRCHGHTALRISPANTHAAFRKLKCGKGVGLDGVPAELLVAGGWATATCFSVLEWCIVEYDQWPRAWMGGLLAPLFKKDDSSNPDCYRGILLQDHSAKSCCYQLRSLVDDVYNEKQYETQCGAAKQRGTDFTTLLITCLLSMPRSSVCR